MVTGAIHAPNATGGRGGGECQTEVSKRVNNWCVDRKFHQALLATLVGCLDSYWEPFGKPNRYILFCTQTLENTHTHTHKLSHTHAHTQVHTPVLKTSLCVSE